MGREETDGGNGGRETVCGAIFPRAVFRLRWIDCARCANERLPCPSPSPPPARGGGIFDSSWPGPKFGRKMYFTPENAPGFWRLYKMTPVTVVSVYIVVMLVVLAERFGGYR